MSDLCGKERNLAKLVYYTLIATEQVHRTGRHDQSMPSSGAVHVRHKPTLSSSFGCKFD